MNEPHENPADNLSRSYQEVLQQTWQLDVEERREDGETGRRGNGETLSPSPHPPASPSPRLPVSPSPNLPVQPSPLRIIEAMFFVGGQPLTADAAIAAIRGLSQEQFQEGIDSLNRTYRQQGRPYAIERRDAGYAIQLRASYRSIIQKLFGGIREARLTQPAVDVLAIVAYRQPVTRQEVESVRGHESGSILRQLVRRGLIAVISRAESGGREVQYGTTGRFLDLFGLSSLEDLPQTEDLQRL